MPINNTLLNELDSQNFECILHEQKYIFKPVFLNPDNNVLPITKSSIKTLTITDNIFSPFTSADMVIKNNDNVFERLKFSNSDTEQNPELNDVQGFNIRGDGRDIMYLEIIPIEKNAYSDLGEEFKRVFGFRNTFVCQYDEEITEEEGSYKRFKLMDYDELLLREKNIFFSTTKLLNLDNPLEVQNLTNEERQVSTGNCLKLILKDALFVGDINAIIDPAGENFEPGASKIFYSSPSQSSAYDDMMYIYDRHVSDDTVSDFSILSKHQYTGLYSLESVSKKFSRAYVKGVDTDSAGKDAIETVIISGLPEEGGTLSENERKTPLISPSFGEQSQVRDYKFFNTDSLLLSNKVNTKIVHSYDYDKKQFNAEQKSSNIETGKSVFAQNYVDGMKGQNGEPSPNLIVNDTKRRNLSHENTFSQYANNPALKRNAGVNKFLRNALLTNIGVELTLPGQVFRRSGKFINVERDGQYVDNKFDRKFIGTYFIINVEHVFVNETEYYNKVIAVKTYHFTDPQFKEDTI
jgi:hypothetical protein